MIGFLRQLLRLAAPYRARLRLGVLFGLLSGVSEPLLLVLVPIVGRVVFPSSDAGVPVDLLKHAPGFARPLLAPLAEWLAQPGVVHTTGAKLLVISLIPLVAVLRGVFIYLNVYFMQWVAIRAVTDLRTRVFVHLQNLSLSFFHGTNTGELMSRITSDTYMLVKTLSSSIPIMIKDPVTVAFTLAVLLHSNAKLTLVTMVAFPICAIPVVIYTRKVRKASVGIQNSYAAVSQLMHEAFTGNRIVKAYNLEHAVEERFRKLARQFVGFYMRAVRSQEMPGPLIECVGAVGVAALFFFYALQPGAAPDKFIQFVLGILIMYRPIKNLVRLYSDLESARAASGRVFGMLDLRPTVAEPAQPVPLHAAGADAQFDNVTFGYGDKPVLRDIQLTVKAGQVVALVGSSGAGKTTLTSLLLRFYDPQQGCVRIGQTDIRQVAFHDLRAQIAVVTQETILFNDTIRNNIALGRPGATEAEIVAAARSAHAHDFIASRPEGYDTVIGEKGVLLSGGQRQRIAIARAILKNAPILVLDEAMSALDTESERAVQAALDELMRGRTTLCIAHRLSTIQHADVIVVLQDGRIVETGRHAELVQRGGVYQKLYDMQFRD